MIRRANRLHLSQDIARVLRYGKSSVNSSLTLKVLANQQAQARFTIIISTKVSKKAVVRNKIKRWLREVIKQEMELLKSANDLVIIVKPGIKELKDYLAVKEVVIEVLAKAKLL
ncbi:MAG: ribonuclease P protein component [Candidatus Buchananbacteria bacterium]